MGLDISEKHAPKPKPKKRPNEEQIDVVSPESHEKNKVVKVIDSEDDDESSGIFTENEDGIYNDGFSTSYSGIHFVRRCLIDMTLTYLEKNPTSFSDSCIKRLNRWISNTDKINYDDVKDNCSYNFLNAIEDFRANDILGIVHFVCHSDYDGYLSEGETLDVFRLLEKLKPLKTSDQEWFDKLFLFTQRCVESKKGMYFH